MMVPYGDITIMGHRGDVNSVAVFPSGEQIVTANSRNPRHLGTIYGGRVCQALFVESKSF